MTHRPDTRVEKLDRYVAAVVGVACLSLVATVLVEQSYWVHSVRWPAVVAFTVMLLVGEMQSIGWLRLRDAGEVTPGWAFAFTLLLLGAPLVAMVAMAFASVLPDVLKHKGWRRTLFNASQTVIALFFATLLLTVTGAHRPISIDEPFTLTWLLAILGAAVVIFTTNSVLTCGAIALTLGVSPITTLRSATRVSVSADGALLVLPPLFAIATDFSLVTLPILGLVAYLIFSSARQALEREHRASHDHLTNLLNAPTFHDHIRSHIARSEATASRGCVLLLDLDGFKTLNDRLGHGVGDDVLRRVGDLLRFESLRGVVGARLGGDEFAVFFPDATTDDEALVQGWAVAELLRAPLDINGFPISTGASIGVVVISPAMTTSEEVLHCADLAMYRAKRRRTTVELHVAQSATASGFGRISLLPDLMRALDRHELWLAFQPQMDCRSGEVVGFEALLRWNHPTRGLVMPNEFIGLAEHTDLIDDLTEQVLAMACRDAAPLLAIQPDLRIAVNVSTRNLRDRHFAATVARILAEHSIAPSSFEIEITESAFAVHEDVVVNAITTLRSTGVRVALDDFGSGYSSFSRLLNTPIDCLKIDQSLIRNMSNDAKSSAVLGAVVDLCQAMGLWSIAEGVEDPAAVDQLLGLGCDAAQGYLIAAPMTPANAAEWLLNRRVLNERTLEAA
jgi:diguanylate cyclase (GGDEF)-like protein